MNRASFLHRDLRAAKTFPQFIRAAAKAYGDAVAISLESDAAAEETATFAELDLRSAELARGLIARGVGKGARVGFIYGNGPSFAVTFAAIARIGAIAVPISTLIKANELVRVLRQSDVMGLIVQRSLLGHDYVERLCEALPGLRTASGPDLRLAEAPYLRWILCAEGDLPAGFHDSGYLSDAAPSVSEALLAAIESEVHPADQVMEIYTSGAMALPKGVKHLHGPLMRRTFYIAEMMRLEPGQRRPSPLPMFWIGGLGFMLLPNWAHGVTTACPERTSTNSRKAMGSVLAEEDLRPAPSDEVIWSIGMTETLGPYAYADTLRVPGYPLTSPLEHIADGFEVRVWDGGEVGDGGQGEIQVRGFAVTPGLHKVEREQVFEPDGFYRTGDLGVRDGTRIHFVGRSGDMIKTASANVSPAEVEMEMQQLEGVHSAYVVGLPDAERGQIVVAAVVARDGVTLDFGDIEAQLRERLSGFKVPRAYVAIGRDEVPMLPSNKVARRQLERMLEARLGRTTG